jgi:catechol 2,3-dioxygenase-like lactoylglutathione lyase family enzyme
MSTRILNAVMFIIILGSASFIFSQAELPAPVLDGGNMVMISRELPEAVEFYRDFVGVDFMGQIRAWAPVTSGLADMYDAKGGRQRNHTLRVQGSTLRLELSEIKDIPTNPVRPRIQDPGAMTITFLVRDIDQIMAKAQQMHVEIVTPGGKAMNIMDNDGPARVIFVKDPTGYYVKLLQRNPLPASTVPPTSNVLGGWMGITVRDTDETVKFYHDMMGFQFHSDPAFVTNKALMEASGIPAAQYRRSVAMIPGTKLPMEFIEYKGVDRKPVTGTTIHDPGVPIMRLVVRDIDAVQRNLKALNVPIVNWSGMPAFQVSSFFMMVRDPNYFFFEFQQPVKIDRNPQP